MIYNLRTNYIEGAPPSSSDLNRRGKILQSQLPLALEALGAGVVRGFAVTGAGSYAVAPGLALVRDGEGTLVAAQSAWTLPVTGVVNGETNFVHLALAIPEAPGQLETVTGDLPLILVSPDEELPNALLLAEISAGGAVTDRRSFTDLAALQARVTQLESDVGYTPEDRAIGSIAQRLDTLSGGEGAGYDDTAVRARLAALEAAVAALNDANGLDVSVYSEADQLTQALAVAGNRINDLEFELFGRAGEIERQQRAAIGKGWGSGELDGPDFDGYGPAKNTDGTFGGS